MSTWKTVRVFISSTFRDMQAERDWLVKRVFPALRQRLEARRIHLVDIDLRWGITREQADNDQVLALCLSQIEECRPFFLGLLGERYGWVPAKFPAEIGSRYGWTQTHTGKSVTELEILHGVLNDTAMHGRALFAFRSPEFLLRLDEEQRRIYCETPAEGGYRNLSREEAERLATHRRDQLGALKQQIRELPSRPPLLDGYPCQWDAAMKRVMGLEAFGNWVRDQLERAITDAPELQEHLAAVRATEHDSVAEERDFHELFVEARTRVYVGRQSLQEELIKFVESDAQVPCLVTGPSGSGKSSALAKFCQSLVNRSTYVAHPSALLLIPHFIGAGPRSTSVREMLLRLCGELKQALGLDDEITEDMRELPNQFRDFLGKVPADCRCVLVFDALNQLDNTDNAHQLFWLPWATQLPPHVRLIASCIDDPDQPDQPALTAMRNRTPSEVKVPLLADDERREILREVPSLAAKTLDDSQIDLLLHGEATRNPLYLLVALEELRGFGSFEQLNHRIGELPRDGDTLTILFQQVITRLGADFDATTVKNVLTLLACARRGLSERELLDMIEGESVTVEESASDLFPILRQLRSYLQTRGPLLDFFHRHLAKAAHETFFKAEADKLAAHRRIAEYFDMQPWFLEPIEEQRKRQRQPPYSPRSVQVRKVDELPWQRIQARDWEGTETLFTTLDFLEAKNEVGMVFELANDFSTVVEALPVGRPLRKNIRLLNEALRRDIQFIARHAEDYPQALFQCIWNSAWWYDCGEAAPHYAVPEGGWKEAQPWANSDAFLKLCTLLERWRTEREATHLGFRWVRHLRPPFGHLGAGQLAVLCGHESSVHSVAFSRDGCRIVSGSGELFGSVDNTVRLWDTNSGRELAVLRGHEDAVRSVAFSPDGLRLVSGSADKTIRLWDAQNGRELSVLRGHEDFVNSVAFSPNGQRIVSGSNDCTIRLWDAQSGQELAVLHGHENRITSVAFSPDGQRLLSGSWDDTVRLWDAQSGRDLTILRGHEFYVTSVAFSPDGQRLLSGSWDRTVRLWETQSGRELVVLRGHANIVTSVAFSADGRRVLSGDGIITFDEDKDCTLRVWEIESEREIAVLRGHEESVNSVAISPDGRRVLSGSNDKTLRLWEIDGGRELAVLHGHDYRITDVAFSSDGLLLSGSTDKTLRLWNTQCGLELAVLRGHRGRVCSVAFSPDGCRILSGSEDHTLRLWDVHSRLELAVLRGHEDYVNSVAFSPDGRRALSGEGVSTNKDKECTVRLWDIEAEREIAIMRGHKSAVLGVAFSPDGFRLVSVSDDQTMRVWDAQSKQELVVLRRDEWHFSSVAFSPNGRCVAIGLWDKTSGVLDATVRLWDIQSGKCLEILRGRGDVKAIAEGAAVLPCRAMVREGETVIEPATGGEPIAWLADALGPLSTHPEGSAWAGGVNSHLVLLQLEGPSPQ